MKTEISRDGFNAGKRYSGVYQQQGRMIIDRDWNELMDVVKARLDAALFDVLGSGSPRGNGVQVQKDKPQSAVRLRPGSIYVDGVGSTVPGLYVSGTGPAQANAGTPITYTFTYKNGSAGAETAVVIDALGVAAWMTDADPRSLSCLL